MALAVSTIPSSMAPNSTSNVKRPTGSYHPSLWADQFQSQAYQTKTVDASTHQDFERLKGEVREMLMDVKCNPSQKLSLIDEIQRLGVGYHFECEIENVLSEHISHESNEEEDLYTVALRFRLLRQQGIKISCDTFEKFKDANGDFKESLISDLPGLLSLYEAAFLGIRGESILDEALAFSRKYLKAKLERLSPELAQQVTRALNRPIWKCLTRIEARHYLTVYPRDESHNRTFLKFAKLDYNILQRLHQKELRGITEHVWWKRLDVSRKLPYARDRIVECFFWITGVYFEPHYSLARRILTRIIAMASILDDTYDNYATVEELELLTEAIQRWDINAVDVLPEYMKTIYRLLIDLYAEIEEEIAKEGRSFGVSYAKEAMKAVARSYFAEAKWRNKRYVPTMDEYLEVSLVSGCYKMLSTSSFLGMGKIADKEAFEYISHDPKIVIASSVICRLMDDIVSSEFEQQREHVASAIQCYMKQHRVSEEEVVKMFREEVANAWKDINEECLKPTAIPLCLLERVLNLARVIDFLYKDGDCYTNSYLVKDVVASTLKDPVT